MEEDEVGRTFVAVIIEHGTGEVHLQKKKFTRRIHAEVHACVAHAVKRLEHPTCGVLEVSRQPCIAHSDIRPRMQIARFQRVGLEVHAFRKLVFDRDERSARTMSLHIADDKHGELASVDVLFDQ